MKTIFCCEDMTQHIKENNIIHYSEIFDEYGINLIEDGSSCIIIHYCPWCGCRLPESRREEWFETLEKKGYENPLLDDSIPEIYKSAKWRIK